MALNDTDVPEQILVLEAVIETWGLRELFTTIMTELLKAVLPVTQLKELVNVQIMLSPLAKVEDV